MPETSSPVALAFHHNGADYSVQFPTREEAETWYGRLTTDPAAVAQVISLDEAEALLFGDDRFDD